MKYNKWYRLRNGDYTMTTWVGDDQLTYRAVRQGPGWVVSRKVAGAGLLILGGPKKTLREAKAVAEDDSNGGSIDGIGGNWL